MTVTHEIDQEYAPYRVRVRGGPDAINLMDVAGAEILDSHGERVCWFSESVEWAFRPKGWSSDQMEVTKRLVERAFHRARGAILLDRVADLDRQRLSVSREESYATRSEGYRFASMVTIEPEGQRTLVESFNGGPSLFY